MKVKQADFVSLIDMGMAYRKAKTDAFYSSLPCRLALLNYEEDLADNLRSLHKKINQNKRPFNLGSSIIVHKEIKNNGNNQNDLVCADPQKGWEIGCQREPDNKPQAEFRLMAQPSIDFHVLSALWLAKVGYKYEAKLSKNSYGNRLRRKKNGDLNPLSLGSFVPYLKPFRDWRDKGICAMGDALKDDKSIIAVTADVQSFFHELSPEFMLDKKFLSLMGLDLTREEEALNKLFINALKVWAASTPLKKGLPVGLPASALVANMALFELDQLFQKEIVPLYYGRYVDDILLVMENGSDLRSSEKVWEWIFERSKGLLGWKNKKKDVVAFKPGYLKDSTIEFSNHKNKVFLIDGDCGKALVDSIARQIHERASEWRSLPSLPENPEHIATELLSATQHDGEEADNLRKADSLSMRRAGFAFKLRDFEAYERDLPPEAWKLHRKAFLKAFIQHVMVPPAFFDLFTYLPRVLQLATACEDFKELKNIIERLNDLTTSVRENCTTSIKSCVQQNCPDHETIIINWRQQIDLVVKESIQTAFPVRLSREGKRLWGRLFENKDILPFDSSIKSLQLHQRQLFSCDLAYMPFRFIGLPNQVVRKSQLPAKKTISYFEVKNQFLESSVLQGVGLVTKMIKCNRGKLLPHGLLWPTRPYNVQELYLLHKTPFEAISINELSLSILALRGFAIENRMPWAAKKGRINIPLDRHKGKYRFAIASWQTSNESWIASVTKKSDPDLGRYKRLTKLLNEIMQSPSMPDYLILPELSIPASWFLRMAHKLQGRGISLICGVEYIHRGKKTVNNQSWAALMHDGLGFQSMIIYRQDKQRPAHDEEKEIYSLAGLKMKPENSWKEPPVICHGDFQFAILICSELTNIAYRASLRGKVDVLFVPQWNKDTASFNSLVESAALDIHAFIIQCNNRLYGDSRIRGPYKNSWERDTVRIKGGLNDYFVVCDVDIETLREFQSSFRSPNKLFKPVPDGFKIAHERKMLPKGEGQK